MHGKFSVEYMRGYMNIYEIDFEYIGFQIKWFVFWCFYSKKKLIVTMSIELFIQYRNYLKMFPIK